MEEVSYEACYQLLNRMLYQAGSLYNTLASYESSSFTRQAVIEPASPTSNKVIRSANVNTGLSGCVLVNQASPSFKIEARVYVGLKTGRNAFPYGSRFASSDNTDAFGAAFKAGTCAETPPTVNGQ